MATKKILLGACTLLLLSACGRGCRRAQPEVSQPPAEEKPAAHSVPAPPARLPEPNLLLSLPFSAYVARIELDGDFVYLFTRDAAYRLKEGQPSQKFDLDLGAGPVLTDSGIVFWSKETIWNASKESGAVRRVAKLSHQPEYFVASSAGLAWLDGKEGVFSIQSLDGQKPRVLVTHESEISAVHMIHEWVFFVHRAKDQSWRVGRVRISGGEPEYTERKSGPTPSMLAGSESPIFYDMQRSEIRQLSLDLKSEQVWRRDFVCSPIWEAKNVFCSRMEGLFEILAQNYEPKPLVYGQHPTVTFLRANAKQVVWIADIGADQLAVFRLPVE